MKRIIVILFIVTLLMASMTMFLGCYEEYVSPKDRDGMTLVWEDNFDGDTLDSKWGYAFDVEEGKVSAPRKGGFWSQDSVFVEDGNLVLRTDWRDDGESGAGWYSGAVSTAQYEYGSEESDSDYFEQVYGYFEVRCLSPYFIGGWSAFWMMPYDNFVGDHLPDGQNDAFLNSGTDGTEIDIFETPFAYQGWLRDNVINHAVHYDGYRENLKSAKKLDIKVSQLYDMYHTYGLEWDKDYYRFYVDGELTWEITSDGYKNKGEDKVNHNIISQVKEYLLLSFEVVAPNDSSTTMGWCGDPSKNDKSKNYDFKIDYVRVYQFDKYL